MSEQLAKREVLLDLRMRLAEYTFGITERCPDPERARGQLEAVEWVREQIEELTAEASLW